MGLYLYCLSDELKAGATLSVTGIAEIAPRVIELGAIKAVVSDVQTHPVRVTKDNVIAHERVIDCVMAQTTPLPFRFGSVVKPDELQAYIASNEDRLRSLLDRVRGAVEMSVKIIWDREAVVGERAKNRPDDLVKAEGAGPGLSFLLAKQKQMEGRQELKIKAGLLASWLDEGLGRLVRDRVVTINPADAMVVRAAHLVERGRVAEYRERVNWLSRERNDLRFLTSGAWPPYSFSHLRS
ncbi:MAG TPA: GvpL/GvpF family gas vesicle protein [Blastocatellia bacterium]|nr:GvpL/GvpF family gas vesicle protein [Blastocatellia bacterium]